MTAKTHSCITIACDVCGDTFTADDQDGTPHFDTVQEARDYQDTWGDEFKWTIRDDGYAICPIDDEEFAHDHARTALNAASPSAEAPGRQEPPAERGFKVGDVVQITGRGDIFDGKTGVVAKTDDDPEFPIGLTVEGFVGLVWCSSAEIRHYGEEPEFPSPEARDEYLAAVARGEAGADR